VWILLNHLLASVLAAEEDTPRIDSHCQIKGLVVGLMDSFGTESVLNGNASIVDHAKTPGQRPDLTLSETTVSHVQSPVLLDRSFDQMLHALAVSNIALDENTFAPSLNWDFVCSLYVTLFNVYLCNRVEVCANYSSAFRCVGNGNGAP